MPLEEAIPPLQTMKSLQLKQMQDQQDSNETSHKLDGLLLKDDRLLQQPGTIELVRVVRLDGKDTK